MASEAVDTNQLWRAERELAGVLGFRLLVKVEQERSLVVVGAGGTSEFVAVCRLEPATPRARAVCAAHRAEAIEAEQKFRDQADAVFAAGDAIRAALELAKDAS